MHRSVAIALLYFLPIAVSVRQRHWKTRNGRNAVDVSAVISESPDEDVRSSPRLRAEASQDDELVIKTRAFKRLSDRQIEQIRSPRKRTPRDHSGKHGGKRHGGKHAGTGGKDEDVQFNGKKGDLDEKKGAVDEKKGGSPPSGEDVVLDAAQYVFEKFFQHAYPPPPDNVSEKVREIWLGRRWAPQCGVQRPNHGVPNAIRKALLVPAVAAVYGLLYGGRADNYTMDSNQHQWLSKERFTFSDDDIKAMQIAIMFEVVGRQSEIGWGDDFKIYEDFRKASIDAFAQYSKGLIPERPRQNAIDGLKQMYMKPVTKYSYPFQVVFEKAHDLELIRCWELKKSHLKVKLGTIIQELGDNAVSAAAARALAIYDEDLLLAMGDNIQYRPSNGGRKFWYCPKFEKVGKNPKFGLVVGRKVSPPALDLDALKAVVKAHGFDKDNIWPAPLVKKTNEKELPRTPVLSDRNVDDQAAGINDKGENGNEGTREDDDERTGGGEAAARAGHRGSGRHVRGRSPRTPNADRRNGLAAVDAGKIEGKRSSERPPRSDRLRDSDVAVDVTAEPTSPVPVSDSSMSPEQDTATVGVSSVNRFGQVDDKKKEFSDLVEYWRKNDRVKSSGAPVLAGGSDDRRDSGGRSSDKQDGRKVEKRRKRA